MNPLIPTGLFVGGRAAPSPLVGFRAALGLVAGFRTALGLVAGFRTALGPVAGFCAALGLVAGCSPSAGREQPMAPLTVPEMPAATASASAARAPEPPVVMEQKRTFAVDHKALPQGIDEDTGPAPCDFQRSYRGLVGKTPVTLKLQLSTTPQGDQIKGLGHYDRMGPALAVAGARAKDGSFVITEKPGGSFEGTCNAKGSLVGNFTMQGKRSPFELKPRPAAWPAMYQVEQRVTSEPNHPLCKKQAKRDQVFATVDEKEGIEVICLPTDPVKKKEILSEGDYLLCTVSDTSYGVFGLADAAAEKRANAVLIRGDRKSMKSEIELCHYRRHRSDTVSLVWAQADLLVVSRFRSDDYGGAHPMNNGGDSTAIDLTEGAPIALDQLVDESRLRSLAGACLPLYAASFEAKQSFAFKGNPPPSACDSEPLSARYLWGCSKNDRSSPLWTLLPAGIVIGAWANPHVSASNDGHGPILPWNILLRAGILRPDARAARLWAGVSPADKSSLPCSSSYEGGELVSWREVVEP